MLLTCSCFQNLVSSHLQPLIHYCCPYHRCCAGCPATNFSVNFSGAPETSEILESDPTPWISSISNCLSQWVTYAPNWSLLEGPTESYDTHSVNSLADCLAKCSDNCQFVTYQHPNPNGDPSTAGSCRVRKSTLAPYSDTA